MQCDEWGFVVITNIGIELFVFILRDVGFWSRPQCCTFIDCFPLLFLFFICTRHLDRQRDMVGILSDNIAEAIPFGKFLIFFAKM